MKICNCCGFELTPEDFPYGTEYTTKNGQVRKYRRKTCRSCYAGKDRNRGREQNRERFRKMVSWAAPVLLTIVTGIYQFDSVSGRFRTCTYYSVYGYHAVTIDAMNMCPLTMEFDV